MAEDQRPTLLGTNAETFTGGRGGFSQQAESPTPSLQRTPETHYDGGAQKLGAVVKAASEGYTGFQSERINQRKEEIQDVAGRDARGLVSPHEAAILERTNKTFAKYFSARRQGAMSDSAANIAVESEIKRVSNQYPALGPQVRKAAFEKLGFDPTGSEWKFLTTPASQGKQAPETGYQKAMREAQQLEAAQPSIQPGTLQNMVTRQFTNQLQIQALEQKQQTGNITSNEVSNKFQRQSSITISQLMSRANQKAMEEGGISDQNVISMQANLRSAKAQQLQQLRTELQGMNASNSEINSQVDALASQYDDAIESVDVMKKSGFLEAGNTQNSAAMTAFADQNFSALRFMDKLGYRSGEDKNALIDIMQNPNSPIRKALIGSSPVLQTLVSSEGTNGLNSLNRTMQGVLEGNRQMISSAGADPNKSAKIFAQGVLNNPETANIGEGDVGRRVLDTLRNNGDEDFALSKIAYNPTEYVRNKGVVNHLKDITNDVTLSQIAEQFVREAGDQGSFKLQNGSIVFDAPGIDAGTWGGAAANFAVNSGGIGFASRMAQKAGFTERDYAGDAFYDVAEYSKQLRDIGTILTDPAMAQRVGLSQGQLVAKLNQSIESIKSRSNDVTNPANDTMIPATDEEISTAAEQEGVDPAYYANLLNTESQKGEYSSGTSSAGARGVAQLMPKTASSLGLVVNDTKDERMDNSKALPAGASYVRKMLDRFDNDYVLADMAYSMGPTALQKILNAKNPDPDIPQETVDHVQKTMGIDVIPYLRDKGLIPTY